MGSVSYSSHHKMQKEHCKQYGVDLRMASRETPITEEVFYLPENIVRNSVGFTFDVGNTF